MAIALHPSSVGKYPFADCAAGEEYLDFSRLIKACLNDFAGNHEVADFKSSLCHPWINDQLLDKVSDLVKAQIENFEAARRAGMRRAVSSCRWRARFK